MRKLPLLLALFFLSTKPLQAQETGEAAVTATAASTGQWKNWVFVSTALVTATAGVLLLVFDNGSAAQSH